MVKWDVEGIDKTVEALKDGIEEGLKDSGEVVIEAGEERAEDAIAGRRVWTGALKNSFVSEGSQDGLTYTGVIANNSGYADVVDRGLAPAGEITGSNPSVQDLMPWVVSNTNPVSQEEIGDVSQWHPDLRDLATKYTPGYVMKAFQVRESIAESGYKGIHFTDKSESLMRQIGPLVTKNIVEARMRAELRKQK